MADVFGTQFADDARDKLVVLMDALVVAVASDTPKLSFSYDRHAIARLQLNAVTTDLQSAESEFPEVADGPAPQYQMLFSFRIHTGYEDDTIDGRTTTRLMEGVVNKLMANQTLGNNSAGQNYRMERIISMTNNVTFTESATVGGEVIALVTIQICYDQD